MSLLQAIKASLKRHPMVFSINARRRARELKRELATLRRHYEKEARARNIEYSAEQTMAEVRRRLQARGLPAQRAAGSLRIFWAGTNQEQDRSGFLQGLQKFGSVTTLVGPNDQYGFTSTSETGLAYDRALIERNSRLVREQVLTAAANGGIDVLIGQMWANFIDPLTLREIQAAGIPVVNVSMDDRLPEHWRRIGETLLGSVGLRGGVDLVLTTTRECCLWYAVEDCRAVYWPLASDPTHFHSEPHDPRDIDVSFIGSKYGVRSRIVSALESAGIEVQAFGPGWPLGAVPAERCAEIFARSKIVLGIGTVGYTDDVYTIKLRDFDAPMSGALYLTHRNPDLLELYREPNEIVCYDSAEECVDAARRYLADDSLRLTTANAGSVRARREHTWEHRIGSTLEAMGLIAPT